MTTYAIIIGIVGAILMLTAGYLFGLYAGTREKEARNQRVQEQSDILGRLKQQFPARPVKRGPSLDLAKTDLPSQRNDLAPLLDKIATAGSFAAMFLSDDAGLPLASTRAANDLDRVAASSARLAVVADQVYGEDGPGLLSIMLRDASGTLMLCRIFHVCGQRLSLTAVSDDLELTPTALDPALKAIEATLATWEDDPSSSPGDSSSSPDT